MDLLCCSACEVSAGVAVNAWLTGYSAAPVPCCPSVHVPQVPEHQQQRGGGSAASPAHGHSQSGCVLQQAVRLTAHGHECIHKPGGRQVGAIAVTISAS